MNFSRLRENRTPPDPRERFRHVKVIYSETDQWNSHVLKRNISYIEKISKAFSNATILNVGSGGYSLGITGSHHIHIDIVEHHIRGIECAVVASAEKLPIIDGCAELCVCVGSVLNYCNLVLCLHEFLRVLSHSGELIIHIEISDSFEFLNTNAFRKDVDIVDTFYNHSRERVIVYSTSYIMRSLWEIGFDVISVEHVHIFSALAYLFTRNERLSSLFARLDVFAARIPFVRNFSDSIIIHCKKR